MNLLTSLKTLKNGLTTYRMGLLQARAYRILKKHSSDVLFTVDLSTLDWALLGLLFDYPKGYRLNKVAELLGVEAPFVTEMVRELVRKGYVLQLRDPKDSRAKILRISEKGLTFVPIFDKTLRSRLKHLLSGLSARDLYGYIKVLEIIIKNSQQSK